MSWLVLSIVVVLAFFVAKFVLKLAKGVIAFILTAIIAIGIVVIAFVFIL